MEYNASKYPKDVADLFKPLPPLKFLKQIDYSSNQRRTSPISGFTQSNGRYQSIGNLVNEYLVAFPKGSENKHISILDKKRSEKINAINRINDKLSDWNPNLDPNIKDTDPYKTIFVGRLPYDITELDLQKIFVKYGQIERIRIVRNSNNKANKNSIGKSRGYGFIVFQDPLSSKMAFKDIGTHKGIEIKGRICIVDIERGRTVKYFKPRRLGGGLGGRGYTTRNKKYASEHSHNVDHTITQNTTIPTNKYPISNTYNITKQSLPSTTRYNTNTSTTTTSQETVPPVSTSYRSRSSRTATSTQPKEDIDY